MDNGKTFPLIVNLTSIGVVFTKKKKNSGELITLTNGCENSFLTCYNCSYTDQPEGYEEARNFKLEKSVYNLASTVMGSCTNI